MFEMLKHTHLLMVTIAVILFVVSFIRLKMKVDKGITPLLTKLLTISHIAILILGVSLLGILKINPFDSHYYWLLEKIIAFGAYIAMVKITLKPSADSKIQWLTFIGAFGWLAYIGKLAVSHQAILLVG